MSRVRSRRWCGPERVAAAYDAADVLLVSSIYEHYPVPSSRPGHTRCRWP